MRIAGHLINGGDSEQNEIFDGFVVEVRYLTLLPGDNGDRVFREQADSFTLQGKDNTFHVDLPDPQLLQERQDIIFNVFTPDRESILTENVSLADLLSHRDRIELKVRNLPAPAKEAFPIRGRLNANDDRTNDFPGYRVSVSYRVQERIDAQPVVLPDSQAVILADGSTFQFTLPNEDALDGRGATIAVRYPDGTAAAARDFTVAELSEEVVIGIDRRLAPTLTTDPAADDARPRKIKGKVVDVAGKNRVDNKQVILWASNGHAPSPVLTSITDANGNFFGDFPRAQFEHALATVADTLNVAPDRGVSIDLVHRGDGGGGLGEFPDFVFVPVEFPRIAGDSSEDECQCNKAVPPRLPDQEDLISNSNTYSQDIGLSCVNFTKPNRTLEEISYTLAVRTTEPEIKGTTISDQDRRRSYLNLRAKAALSVKSVSLDTPHALTAPLNTTTLALSSPVGLVQKTPGISLSHVLDAARAAQVLDQFKAVPGRGALTAANSVDWDSTPTFYQSTTVAHGHLLHFKQVWKADGYSMGDLIYSLPLAPGQKKQVVIFDWDRSEYGRRDETSHEDEALSAYLSHDRDVLDIVNSALNENVRGGSSSRTSGSAGGIGAGIGALLGPVMIGVAGGYSASSGSSSASAWQDSSRNLSANALNQLRDSIQQASSAVRNQRSTVVQTARQTERFKVETESVANYNHCHAITIEYFEILRHYAIEQQLADVQECLFIPLLMSEFDIAKIVRWRDIISRAMLVSGPRFAAFPFRALIPDPLTRGLDAAERIYRNYEGSDFPAGSYAEESIISFSGEMRITFQLNRPHDADDDNQDAAHLDQLITLAALNASPAWAIFAPLIGGLTYIHSNFFANQVVRHKNKIFEERVAPVIAEAVADKLVFTAVSPTGVRIPLKTDTTLVSDYRRDAELYVTVRPTGAVSVRRDMIEFIEISSDVDLSKSENSKIIIRSATFRYSTPHMSGYLAQDYRVDNDLKPSDPVTLYTPLSTEEKRKPREEDKQYSRKLLEHLNSNIEYYHKAIWKNMDQDRRYMLLDGFVAPNSGGRSVASVVENRVIGIAGNCLIMPVAPGYKLDPSYEYEPLLDDRGEPMRDEHGNIIYKTTDLIEHYRPRTPIPPYRVSVPTRGVFAEAVQGACNSCEKIERERFWRWEESPIPDQPTQIAPVQTQPPQRTDPGKLEPTPFPSPIVNFQNAPAAPEPGAALAGTLALLGKPDLFKDITGLDQTQKNALQAMLSNQESARHFADKAAELAIQASNVKNGDSTIDAVKRAVNDGSIDKDTGKKLIEDVFRAQIGGKQDPDKNTANNSDLAKAAAKAVDQGRSVKASQTHPDGTGTTVDQKSPSETAGDQTGSGAISFDYTVPGVIPAIAQPDSMSCWATVATMMTAWKTQSETVDIDTVVAKAGPKFVTAYQNKAGLARADKLEFIQKLGMIAAEGNFQSHTYDFFLNELKTFGPLWMTVDVSSKELALHAKILYGMHGDGTASGTDMRIVDPNGGKRYETTFQQFAEEYEGVAFETPANEDLFVQIVRFADTQEAGSVSSSEGSAPPVLPFASAPYLLPGAPDVRLQAALQQAINDVEAAGMLGTQPRVPFSIIALASDGKHLYAGVRDGELHYSASLLKAATMYCAHELLRAAKDLAATGSYTTSAAFLKGLAAMFDPLIKGAALASVRQAGVGLAPQYAKIIKASGFEAGTPTIEFSDEFKTKMSEMIIASNNASAGECVRRLGYSYVNAALMKGGFYDPAVPQGIWLAGDYSSGANPYVRIATVNDGLAAQVTSTREMCKLFALIQLGTLVDAGSSASMQKLLQDTKPVDQPWIDRATIKKFDVDSAKIGLGPLKTGTNVYSEAAILRWNGDAPKLAAKKLTGEIAVCWQNLRIDSLARPFDGIADVVNRAFAAFLQ